MGDGSKAISADPHCRAEYTNLEEASEARKRDHSREGSLFRKISCPRLAARAARPLPHSKRGKARQISAGPPPQGEDLPPGPLTTGPPAIHAPFGALSCSSPARFLFPLQISLKRKSGQCISYDLADQRVRPRDPVVWRRRRRSPRKFSGQTGAVRASILEGLHETLPGDCRIARQG